MQSGLIPLLRSLGSRYIRTASESNVVSAASSELRNLFQKKQLVVVAPLLAKQNNVSPFKMLGDKIIITDINGKPNVVTVSEPRLRQSC